MSKDNFVPLSQTQLGIYLDCVRRGEGTYNRHFLYTLDNNIDMERLAAAIDKAVAAHPYMNARIAERDGEPVQYIPDDIEAYHQDVKYMTEDEWHRELPRLIATPLQLVGGRLFRFDLVQTEKAKYFLRTAHHITFDGTAYQSLFADIAAAYNGQDVMPEGYNAIDAARDEAEKRGGSEYETAKKYYDEKFSGLDTESMPLPDIYGESDSFESYEHEFNLNYDDMRSFCHEHNISASALTSAAFGFTLGTYTHQREALFSTIYHGRKDERTTNIIGMFVKTFPVYCRWSSDTRVAELLTELTEQIKNSRNNDIFSFADLNRICPNFANDKPLFAYHGMIKTTSTFCGLPCEEKILDKDTTGYQLGVELLGEPDGMKLHIEYNAGKYSRSFIENFARTYETVLNQFMSCEYIIDIEPADERQLEILDSFNDTDTPYDDTQTIVSLFRKAASENAERTAVIFKDIKLTYQELDDITERIAGYIANKGLGVGDVVSILIPRDEYMPIASIGALKSGCAYQPLDPTYPPERLNFMVQDSNAKLLITPEELRPLITDYNGDVLLLSEVASLPASNAKLPEIKPENLFILLYTSGSTGTPKGVRLTHGNIVCFVNWYHRYYNLHPEDCIGQYASFGFDAGMQDICSAVTLGATLCVIPEEIRLDLNAINEYIERHHVTHQFMTTQIARQFAVNIENHSLKTLLCGGEKLVPLTPPAGYKFQNGYGPTECTCCVAVYHVKEYMENIPIGKANDNVKLYIVDSGGHRVPVGALGELWVSSPQVGDGYLNLPEKTDEVFINNPFSSEKVYSKVYKTGDIVRYRADGNIEFFGRSDGQVKIRGFRIELSEVEAVIRQFPGVTDATVAAFDSEAGEGKYLAAYVVSGDKIDIKALNEFIKSQKPPYMVPAVTMQIDKIPLNQNGKVNKRALPKPEFKDEENEEDSGRSLDVLEKELCAITGKVIGTENISLTTPLIYMGLDSIRSIQLSTQIYKRFNIEIQSTTLLNGATLEDINDAVLNGFMSGHAVPQSVEKIEIKEAPLSYPQTGVYFECVNHPNDTLYNIPSMFIFGAETDAQKLADAVEAIVMSHPALTTHFEDRDDNIVQVRGTEEIKAEILEMSEAELDEYKRNFVRPFDLSQGPLCRFAVVRTPEHVYLLSDFHHLVFDGASLNLFIKELAAALNDGRLPEPESYTYFDYVLDEKKFEQSPEFEENRKYFADMLSGFERASEITADISGRKVEKEGRVGSVSSPFDLKAASDFCKTQATTPAALFLAASFYAISRYVNDNHVYLSTISSGRSDVKTSETYGMFVNTLPLGIEIKDETAEEFLKRSADVFDGAIRHEKYPFARIAGDYGFEPNIMYGYQIGVVEEEGGLKLEPLKLEMPKFKLEIMIEERNGEACVTVNYNDALYSASMMQSLARSIVIVAEGMIAAPEKNIRDLSLLDGEQLAILDSFNNTEHPYDATQTIVSLFRKAASENADRTAVIFKDIKLTYQELDDITERIAGYIANKGLGVGDVVSILIPRDEYMPIASIGALKAGCAYQPLDPTYPPERLNFMIKDSNAKLLITTEELRPLITDYNGDVLLLSEIASLPVSNAKLPEVKPENLFILLYTSGSTGTPKGVRLTHGNIVCFVNWYHRYYNLHPEDCIGQYASFGFDACMMDMYSPLTRGAALCIIPEEIRLDLTAINEYLEKNHVTHQFMTTQVCRQFAVNVENKTLKHLLSGGEKLISLDPPTAYTLYNGYGPTECTIFTTTYPVTENEENIPIGKPLDNLKLYVVDGDGHRVPVGAMGELWIAGPQVGDGYLNQPERTAEAFIDNPFNSDPNYNKVYKTGDIVRYRADGNIEFFGRSDGQVKIRGFRIELSEVEAVIRQFPGITDATVAAFDSESSEGKYLVAYVVSGDKIDIKALKEFIKSQKPPYMVPAVTMQIDKIPLNQNSKVNKRALPKPEFKDEENSEDSSRPLNVMEQELCAITGKVIGTENIPLTTPLSYMGLDSIRSIQLSTQIYKRFNIEIQSRTLLDGATLADVENYIWRSFMSGKREERTANPAEIKEAPLSYPQMGVYYDCMKRPSEMLYNMPSLFAFPKDIDVQKLSGAIKAIVKAHPALTAHFELKEGNVTQVRGSNEIKAEILEMSEQELDEYKKNFVRPFDLSKEPLCRFIIVKTENRVCLLTDFHHLVFDGASLNLFIKELAAALNDNRLPEPESYTYFDYVLDEKKFEQSPEFEENRKYFADMLSGFERASEITADISGRKVEKEGRTDSVSFPFDLKTASDFCKTQETTPAALFLAASFYAVSRYVNDNHVYLATISNGRSDVKTAETYGMFVNTLPLGVEIRDETAAEFLKRSADVFDGAIRHEKYPFARIANDYGFEPNIMYGYQIGVVEEEGGLKCEPLKLEMPKFKLEIMIEERNGEACVTVNYNNALYSKELMQNLARSIVIAAEGIMAAPAKNIRDLSLLDGDQLAILDSFNATEIPYDHSQTIVSLFRKAARKNAERTAVIFNNIKLNYKELDDITERLAGYIANKGLGVGDVVSILIPRGEYMPITVIGVLKAGCAYQPLDSTYPPERLNFMLKDSGAKLLITTEELRPLITDYKGEVLILSEIASMPACSVKLPEVKPEDLFILLYTSGSTGTPKGVRLTHANLVCFINWYHRYFELQPKDCVGQYASFGFDACMMDICTSLTRGAALCIIPEEIRLDLNAINEYMERHHVTHQFMTTQVARQFAVNIKNYSLKALFCGGEKLVPLTPPTAYTLHNGYGPTESTCCVAVYHVKEYMENIPIGKANDNVKLYIVDSGGHRVPVGALGELWVSSPQVGDGYLNLPDKTAEVFIDNPFNSDPDYNKIYKTGDIVRYLPDGNIEFFGRSDGQVKIRGFRIELSEVEAVIRQFPGITDATVAAFDNKSGEGKYLAAYVVSDEKVDIKALNDFIKSKKPLYMVPAVTMQIDKIPLTQNSKVNKRALPKAVAAQSDYEAAANDVERAFCKIFCSILQLDDVGATEDFFSLGGTSILVTLLLIEAEKAGYKVTFQDVFSRPTPRALAALFTDETTKTEREENVKDKIRDYDYTKLQAILDVNTLESFKAGARQDLGDILLTGATGYLGIHILHELLERYDGKVYCLLRSKGGYTAERRLKNQLFYYFENTYDDLLNKRLFVIDGDITKPIDKLPVSTVINCAAVVKHFSAGTEIEDVNVGGVKNLIDYCLANNARLIQVSTISTVSMGMSDGEVLEEGRMIGEYDLYFGQSLDNKYVRSKFLAERLILEAVAEKGLNAKIMRVGNLAARYSDGEFQINYGTNSAMGRLKIYALLGVCPYEQLDVPMEFSPIDEVAKAILLLSRTPKECVIFHPYNHNTILSGNVFDEMGKLGLPVRPVEREEFDAAMAKAGDDPVKAKLLTSMLAYQNGNKHGAHIPRHNTYTMQVLYRMGYSWPVTSWDYVEQFISVIKALGFFDF